MHYKRKKTAKQSSNSFYLEQEVLLKLDKLGFIYNQSRNIIIETALRFYLRGDYEKSKRQSFKKKKKVPFQKKPFKRAFKTSKEETKEQKFNFTFST